MKWSKHTKNGFIGTQKIQLIFLLPGDLPGENGVNLTLAMAVVYYPCSKEIGNEYGKNMVRR